LGKNRGYPYWIWTPNERVLSHQVPDVRAKFHQKSVENCDCESADRQTDKHTHRDDTGDRIICPMLCYSNGTDNNHRLHGSAALL